MTPSLLFGGTSPETARRVTPSGSTLTLADLVTQHRLGAVRCQRCVQGSEPCPLFLHDEAAFDHYGFLQATLPGDDDARQPYTGVTPLQAESPGLRRALAESAMRLLYPYPCWPLCDTLQILEEPLSDRQVTFLRSSMNRLRKAYLATDPVSEAAIAEDEGLVHAARSQGLDGRQSMARVSGHWLLRLPLAVVVPQVWVPGTALSVDFALVHQGQCHAIHLETPSAELAAAAEAAGWRLHWWQHAGAAPEQMESLLQACGLLDSA